MASQGPNSPTSGVNTSFSANPWANPDRIVSSNNSYATCVIGVLDPDGDSSDGLDATDFGFALPAFAVLTGVIVEFERAKSPAAGVCQDLLVQLIKGGTAQGDDKSSATAWPSADAYATYGSSSDMWSLSLLDTDVEAVDFGVRIRCINPIFDATAVTARVDHVRITVHYDIVAPTTTAPPLPLIGVGA